MRKAKGRASARRKTGREFKEMVVVSNTHWDREFRMSFQRTRQMLVEMMDYLLDLLDGEAAARRKAIFGAIFTHVAVDIDDPASSLKHRWGIEGHWKLIIPCATNVPDGQVELYDLQADPHEKRNLAAAHPDRGNRLRIAINNWWAAE